MAAVPSPHMHIVVLVTDVFYRSTCDAPPSRCLYICVKLNICYLCAVNGHYSVLGRSLGLHPPPEAADKRVDIRSLRITQCFRRRGTHALVRAVPKLFEQFFHHARSAAARTLHSHEALHVFVQN